MLAALLLTVALAQDLDDGFNDEGLYEVRVHAEDAVEEARLEVVEAIEDHGWTYTRTRGRTDYFDGPTWWAGRAELSHEGLLDFGTTPTKFSPGAQDIAVGTQADNPFLAFEAPPRLGGGVTVQRPSKKKLQAARDRLLAAVQTEMYRYRDAIQAVAFEERLEQLPRELDALWTAGVPIEGPGFHATPDERRRAALAFWAGRANTPEGEAVRAAVALWLEQVVQPSGHPVTDLEQARANDEAIHPDRLTLATPR